MPAVAECCFFVAQSAAALVPDAAAPVFVARISAVAARISAAHILVVRILVEPVRILAAHTLVVRISVVPAEQEHRISKADLLAAYHIQAGFQQV